MLRLAVLVSGSGSNLQALLDACAAKRIAAEVALVVSNKADAYALVRAKDAGVETVVLDHKAFPSREAFDAEMAKRIEARGVGLVCLAGFMRLLSKDFVTRFQGRLVNIHPSLLPAFPGLHGARQALEAGVRLAGCTVHFVDEGCDTGPVIIQAAVPILPGDTEETLAGRILVQEHRIYPRAVDLVARGKVRLDGRRAIVEDGAPEDAALVNPPIG